MNTKKGTKRHSWIRLQHGKSQCVSCKLIRKIIPGNVEYYYEGLNNIIYSTAPDCTFNNNQ
jgi:hypothetical protein